MLACLLCLLTTLYSYYYSFILLSSFFLLLLSNLLLSCPYILDRLSPLETRFHHGSKTPLPPPPSIFQPRQLVGIHTPISPSPTA